MDIDNIMAGKIGGLSQPIEQNKDGEFREALSLCKDIYMPIIQPNGKQRYYLSSSDLEFSVQGALNKYGIKIIREFHKYISDCDWFGQRAKWYSSCIESDIADYIWKKDNNKGQKIDVMLEAVINQISRYLHLIYAENIAGENILEQPSRPYLNELAREASRRFSLEDIELLMDLFNSSEKFRKYSYGRKPDIVGLGNDILATKKWKTEQ